MFCSCFVFTENLCQRSEPRGLALRARGCALGSGSFFERPEDGTLQAREYWKGAPWGEPSHGWALGPEWPIGQVFPSRSDHSLNLIFFTPLGVKCFCFCICFCMCPQRPQISTCGQVVHKLSTSTYRVFDTRPAFLSCIVSAHPRSF